MWFVFLTATLMVLKSSVNSCQENIQIVRSSILLNALFVPITNTNEQGKVSHIKFVMISEAEEFTIQS